MNDWKQIVDKEKVRLNLYSILKKKLPTPSNESNRLFNAQHNVCVRSYPKTCKTDEQKFFHLGKLFINKEIEPEMFITFAYVLKFQHPKMVDKKDDLVQEFLDKRAERDIKWEL